MGNGINGLFSHLLAIFGDAWAKVVGVVATTAVKRSWVDGLKGLTREQIKQGLDDCRNGLHYCPQNPAEFRVICEGKEEADVSTRPIKTVAKALEHLREMQLACRHKNDQELHEIIKTLSSKELQSHILTFGKNITGELINAQIKRRDELLGMDDRVAHHLSISGEITTQEAYLRICYLREFEAAQQIVRYEKEQSYQVHSPTNNGKTKFASKFNGKDKHWSDI